MDFAELNVKERARIGKNESRKLRAEGKVPAVIYGDSKGAIPLVIDGKAFKTILQKEGYNVIFKLKGLEKAKTAMIKDIQRNPIKDTLVHIDFKVIAMDEKIEATVPLELVGDADGVREGGVLQQQLREVSIKALPHEIPEKFELDVAALNIGDALKVSDISILNNVEILNNTEDQVVSVVPPTELTEEELAPPEEEEELEGEEGEEEAGEEGAEEGAEEKPAEEKSAEEGKDKDQKQGEK